MNAIVGVGHRKLVNLVNLFWKTIMYCALKRKKKHLSNSLEISFSNPQGIIIYEN